MVCTKVQGPFQKDLADYLSATLGHKLVLYGVNLIFNGICETDMVNTAMAWHNCNEHETPVTDLHYSAYSVHT